MDEAQGKRPQCNVVVNILGPESPRHVFVYDSIGIYYRIVAPGELLPLQPLKSRVVFTHPWPVAFIGHAHRKTLNLHSSLFASEKRLLCQQETSTRCSSIFKREKDSRRF